MWRHNYKHEAVSQSDAEPKHFHPVSSSTQKQSPGADVSGPADQSEPCRHDATFYIISMAYGGGVFHSLTTTANQNLSIIPAETEPSQHW